MNHSASDWDLREGCGATMRRAAQGFLNCKAEKLTRKLLLMGTTQLRTAGVRLEWP